MIAPTLVARPPLDFPVWMVMDKYLRQSIWNADSGPNIIDAINWRWNDEFLKKINMPREIRTIQMQTSLLRSIEDIDL